MRPTSEHVVCLAALQVNVLDDLGQTALHRAAQQGNMAACRLLLQYGANSAVVSLPGYTAAQLAPDSVQRLLRGEGREGAREGGEAEGRGGEGRGGRRTAYSGCGEVRGGRERGREGRRRGGEGRGGAGAGLHTAAAER